MNSRLANAVIYAPRLGQQTAPQGQQMFIAQQATPKPRLTADSAMLLNAVDLAEGGLNLYFARPAFITPPPVSGDVVKDSANRDKYDSAQLTSLVDAKRTEVLISSGALIARTLVRWWDSKNAQRRNWF